MKSSLNPKWESVSFIKQFQRAEITYGPVNCCRIGCGLLNIQRFWSYRITEFINLLVTVLTGRRMWNTEKTNSIVLETCLDAGGVYSLLIFKNSVCEFKISLASKLLKWEALLFLYIEPRGQESHAMIWRHTTADSFWKRRLIRKSP